MLQASSPGLREQQAMIELAWPLTYLLSPRSLLSWLKPCRQWFPVGCDPCQIAYISDSLLDIYTVICKSSKITFMK